MWESHEASLGALDHPPRDGEIYYMINDITGEEWSGGLNHITIYSLGEERSL